MDINDIFPNGLSIVDAAELLSDVGVYVIGIAIYAVFVFNFYRFLASRDMFQVDFSRYEQSKRRRMRTFLGLVFYIAKYLILFPGFAFFWFAVLTLMLALLSKGRPITDILLVALATVSAIRVVAYYNEDLSKDLAKILPFALMGLFLIDASFFRITDSLEVIRDANDHRETILYYLLFLIVMEFVLRMLLGLTALIFGKRRTTPSRDSSESSVISEKSEMMPPEEALKEERAGAETTSAESA